MQLAYKLLPVKAGQDSNLPVVIANLRCRSRIYVWRPSSHVVRRASSVMRQPQQTSSSRYSCDARRGTQDGSHRRHGHTGRHEVNYGRPGTR
jgi:hypothetical protein